MFSPAVTVVEAFRKFVGFRVLEYFLHNPSKEIHLRELARLLKISPRSAKIYCDLFEGEGILSAERRGNLRIFRLNRDSFIARELIRAYYLLLLKEFGIEGVCRGCSLAVYGSFAAREVDERSDLDMLVVGDEGGVNYDLLRELEGKIGRRVQLTVVPFHRWELMKRERDEFAESVLRKHVLIRGAPL